ncbi:MAG TPA: hypothetical protein VFT45_03295 [Longimicrobium sp.]|nr:hypothetical protein [Longimicrobium sp.]
MPSLPVDLHARDHHPVLAARDPLSPRAALALLAAMWAGALLLAGVGVRVTYGEWPGVYDWLVVTPLLTLFAMPTGLLDLFGLPYHGGSAMLHSVFLAFWAVMLVLHVLAVLTGRRVYVAAIAVLLAPAAWNWAVHASGLMGI